MTCNDYHHDFGALRQLVEHVGAQAYATSIFCAWLLGNTSMNVPEVVIISVAFAALIGCVNGFVVVTLRIDSFIGTLATGSLLQSVILIVSGDQDLTAGLTPRFLRLGTASVGHVTVPVFVMHGDDDQIVPYADSAPLSAKLLKNGTLKTYKGFPHGMPTTEAETINADLLAFLKA